jgi:uncharacterized protein
MWETIGKAICLMLIFEGALPFLYPGRWRRMVISLAMINDRQLRMTGLVCMIAGASALYLLN